MKRALCLFLAILILFAAVPTTVLGARTSYTKLYDDFTDPNYAQYIGNVTYRNVGCTPNKPTDPYDAIPYAVAPTDKTIPAYVEYYRANSGGLTLSVIALYEQPLVSDLTGGWNDWESMVRALPIKIYVGSKALSLNLINPDGFKLGGAGNHMYIEYLVKSLPSDTNYVKIELPSWNDDRFALRQIGRVELTSDPNRMVGAFAPIWDLYAEALCESLDSKLNYYAFCDKFSATKLQISDYNMVRNSSDFSLPLPNCGTITGYYTKSTAAQSGYLLYNSDKLAGQALSVNALYYKDMVDEYAGGNWSNWQVMVRKRPIIIYVGNSANSLHRIAPNRFMINGAGNDMSVEYIVDELPADTTYLKVEIPANTSDSPTSLLIGRIYATKYERFAIGTYEAEPDMYADDLWKESGIEIIGKPEYSFKDTNGQTVYNPVAGGSATVYATAKAVTADVTKITMIGSVYNNTSGDLGTLSLSSANVAQGQKVDLTCTVANLPEGVTDDMFKTYFWANTQNVKPLVDYNFPYAKKIAGNEGNVINVVSPIRRTNVYSDNIVIKVFTSGVKSVSFSCAKYNDIATTQQKRLKGENAQYSYNVVFASNVIPNADGYVEAVFPASQFPYGPIAISITGDYIQAGRGLDSSGKLIYGQTAANSYTNYLQLYNYAGIKQIIGAANVPTPPAAQGMKLAMVDDFDGPLSISREGQNAFYQSHTLGWKDFGDALFKDYENGENPFIQKDSFLRIRSMINKKNGGYEGGLISSEHNDGTTTAFTLGYWECRLMCPPGAGTWPAFWLLSSKSSPQAQVNGAEIDILEGYGAWIDRPTYTYHRYVIDSTGKTVDLGKGSNVSLNSIGMTDTAQSFHTYAAKICSDKTYYYIDDVKVWEHDTFPESTGPMYYLINLALGPGWKVLFKDYDNAVDMYVDYMRVYVPN